ncbi:AAC(3) family N-acetyltransferase [Paenibacillus macerans]|uniref:AAC(3) family N-acetyltransferase n=1 Tax=Paenibacillus macerans TaxID=44252 RepID=UPI003D314672
MPITANRKTPSVWTVCRLRWRRNAGIGTLGKKDSKEGERDGRYQGTLRSGHPQVSFAARGARAGAIVAEHRLEYGLGEGSPLARIYELSGDVLLLGVGHGNNTSLHLAEYRASYPGKATIINKAPMNMDGVKQWVEFAEIEYDSADFERHRG